jgi:hypothetical protein
MRELRKRNGWRIAYSVGVLAAMAPLHLAPAQATCLLFVLLFCRDDLR